MVQFIGDYWGLIVSVIFAIIAIFGGAKTAKVSAFKFAKGKAVEYMLVAEKKAEELALANGQEKLKFVIHNVYSIFPARVRVFISEPMFENIAQELFDTIVGQKKQDQPPLETDKPEVQPETQPVTDQTQTPAQ